MGIPDELCLVVAEVFEEKCSQVSIFTEVQQVLHVKRVHAVLRIVVDDLVGDEEGLVRVVGSEAIHGETTRQTSDRAEETFERLGHVMGDEVFVDLHHCDDTLLRVGQRSFTAHTDDFLIMHHPEQDWVRTEPEEVLL